MAVAITGSEMLGDEVRYHVAAHRRRLRSTAKQVEVDLSKSIERQVPNYLLVPTTDGCSGG
jgi:hypothetical protein